MTDYTQLRIDLDPCSEDATDLLAAFLADMGYETFCPDPQGLTAYIPTAQYDPQTVADMLADFPIETDASFNAETVKGQNWNEEWEKHYFQPIVIDGRCVVHSSFHRDVPQAEYDIVIDPKMAFGTGHHATTSLMAEWLLESDPTGLDVWDVGTGTGILAILALMRGARKATGIEIDPGAWENALENTRLNHTPATMLCGDASLLPDDQSADLLLANINRNVITADLPRYAAAMRPGATMLLSGFYTHDIPIIEQAAAKEGLTLAAQKTRDNWASLRLVKN